MSGLSFGDLAQSYTLKTRIGTLKSQTVRLSEELATGIKADIPQSLSGDLRQVSALEHARVMLKGHLTASRHASTISTARLSVVERLSDHVTETAVSVATLSQGSSVDQVRRVSDAARDRFEDAIRGLNTQIGGRPLFSGTATNGPAVASATTILATLSTLTTGATTAAEIEGRVLTWFNDPNGFGSTGYLGSGPAQPTTLADDGASVSDRTAAEPQIVKTLTALALASLMDHSGLSASGVDRMALKNAALAHLSTGADAAVDLSARIGGDVAKADAAVSRLQTEDISYEMALADLIGVDAARTATELEAARTNLETVYAVTARLARLTLAEFLR